MNQNLPSEQFICPIWGTAANLIINRGGYQVIESGRAGGRYRITTSAEDILRTRSNELSAKLSTWIFNEHEIGNPEPNITTYLINDIKTKQSISFTKKIENFFIYINKLSPNFDFRLRISRANVPSAINDRLSVCIEATDTTYVQLLEFFRTIRKSQYIALDMMEEVISIEPKGWEYLETLSTKKRSSDVAFVAMWFDKSLHDVFNREIHPALEECGYTPPFRIDQLEHSGKIDDEIISRIIQSNIVIVDLTCRVVPSRTSTKSSDKIVEARGGVYFEAGYAKGLNIPVIWTCRNDCVDHIHFDTRQYSQIVWHERNGQYYVNGVNGRKTFKEAIVNRITVMNLNRRNN